MRRKAWTAAIAAALLSTVALAQGGPGMGPWQPHPGAYGRLGGYGPGMMGQGASAFTHGDCVLRAGLAEDLGLTPEQRTRIAAIFDEAWPQHLDLLDEMYALRLERFRGGAPGYLETAQARERMYALDRATRERVEALLTPQQRERMHDAGCGFDGWF